MMSEATTMMPMSMESMTTMSDVMAEDMETTTVFEDHEDYEDYKEEPEHDADFDPLGKALDDLNNRNKKALDEMKSGVVYEDEVVSTSSSEEVHDSSMAPDGGDSSSDSSSASSEEMSTKKPKMSTMMDGKDMDTETEMVGTVNKKNYDAMPDTCRPFITMSTMSEKSKSM